MASLRHANTASQIMMAEHVLEFPEQQQAAVRTDLGTMKAKLLMTVKIVPSIAVSPAPSK